MPSATEPGHSFPSSHDDLRATITDADFKEVIWLDRSDVHRIRYGEIAKQAAVRGAKDTVRLSGPSPLGIRLVFSPDATVKRGNTKRNLMENRIGYVQGLFRKRR